MEESGQRAADWGQDENGIDLELLRHNLSLSVAERIEQHNRALRNVHLLGDAAERAGYRSIGSQPRE